MDVSILKKIGLTDKEIKVYLTLLEHGGVSVRGLSDLTGLNRGTVYDVLKGLQERGLVSYYQQDTRQKFAAEDSEKILKLVRDKEEELKKTRERITGLIPELRSLQDKGGARPATKLYEGRKGIKYILEDVLSSLGAGEEYYVYSAKDASEDANSAFPEFTGKRIKKKIKVRAISLAKGGKTHGLDERKWLGTDDESATFIIIYKDKCAFISRDLKGEPVGVIIENKMVYETQKIIFIKLWNLL